MGCVSGGCAIIPKIPKQLHIVGGLYQVEKLAGGGTLINGAIPNSFSQSPSSCVSVLSRQVPFFTQGGVGLSLLVLLERTTLSFLVREKDYANQHHRLIPWTITDNSIFKYSIV